MDLNSTKMEIETVTDDDKMVLETMSSVSVGTQISEKDSQNDPEKLAKGRESFIRSTLKSIVIQLGNKNFIPRAKARILAMYCSHKGNQHKVPACLRDLLILLKKTSRPPVISKKCFVTEEVDAKAENEALKQYIRTIEKNFLAREEELKLKIKKLEDSNAALIKEMENLKQRDSNSPRE